MEDNFLPISVTSFVLGLLFRRLEYSFQSAAERTDALSRVCDSGVNINLLSSKVDIGRDLSSSQTPQDFPLVCVKGVVKAYDHDLMTRGKISGESSALRGLDGRPCSISVLTSVEHYDSNPLLGDVTDRRVEQVPWCLTSYDSRTPKILVDQEAVREDLQGSLDRRRIQQHFGQRRLLSDSILGNISDGGHHESGYLRAAGVEKSSRTWWDVFTLQPHRSVVCQVLPVLTKCSIIGSITLNTEGEYLLTAHPKFGFFLFGDITFQTMASVLRSTSAAWCKASSRCWYLRVGCFCSFAISTSLLIYSRQHPGVVAREIRAFKSYMLSLITGNEVGNTSEFIIPNNTTPSSSNMNMCVICLSEARTVLVRPCRHLCLCLTCFRDNYSNDNDYPNPEPLVCPICRVVIESHEMVYNP